MKNPAAQKLGRLGGLAKSAAKTAAFRENGKLGGRPKKPKRAARLPNKAADTLAASDALHLDTLNQRNEIRNRVIQYIKVHDYEESSVDELKFALDDTAW